MGRLNVYIKKGDEDLVEAGKKKGISPSQAVIEGYKSLMGKTANYSILQEKRDTLLKELSHIEYEMDKLKNDIIIDPSSQEKVLKDLARGYLNDGVIYDSVLDVRRVELNLNMEDMKKLVKEKVVDLIDSGQLTKLDLDSFYSSEKSESGIDKAIAFFKRQYEGDGKIDKADLKMWASGLNLESDKLLLILKEEFCK